MCRLQLLFGPAAALRAAGLRPIQVVLVARAGAIHGRKKSSALGLGARDAERPKQVADLAVGLVVADLESFTGGGHSGRQVAILAKSLGQNRSQGCVRIHHQNPLGLTSGLGWGQAG